MAYCGDTAIKLSISSEGKMYHNKLIETTKISAEGVPADKRTAALSLIAFDFSPSAIRRYRQRTKLCVEAHDSSVTVLQEKEAMQR